MYQFLFNPNIFQRTIENFRHGLLWNLFDGRLQITLIFLQQSANLPEDHLVLVFTQGGNTTFIDADFVVRDDLLQVDFVDGAQSFAV